MLYDGPLSPRLLYLHWCLEMSSLPHAPPYPVSTFRGSTSGPHFLLSDGTPLNWQWLISGIQSILSDPGVPGCYIGHSFCIGTAISAASYGLPDHLIKMLSKWSSHAYQIYMHTLISTIMGVASLLTWQVISCISSSLSCFFCRVLRDFGSSGPGLAVEGLQFVRHCL